MAKDYDVIKKYYGEKFAQWCRSNFPTILNMGDGVLSKHIMSLFAPNKNLYDDLYFNDLESDAKSYISSIFFRKNKPQEAKEEEPPAVLMKRGGYNLYECKTVQDVECFKRYYRPSELLCTFKDIAGRLDSCYVFFAVKDDVDKIRRQDFTLPRRQDEYGTSVISLQFTKGKFNDLSIKNRYNHTVPDPDATFSNDLENIYPGLTDSFAQHYGFQVNPIIERFTIPRYITANDGKMYKYNLESCGAYFCPDNIVIKDGKVNQLDKYSKILVGDYIFDTHKKTIHKAFENNLEVIDINDYDLPPVEMNENLDDAFIASVGKISRMEVAKDTIPGSRVIKITNQDGKDVHITIDKNNDIIAVMDNDVKEVGDEYLSQFFNIEKMQMDNLEKCGDNFAFCNRELKNVNFPNLKYCGRSFLYMDPKILTFNTPNLISVKDNFCLNDKTLTKLYLPQLEQCGHYFFDHNVKLEDADFSKLKKCGNGFLEFNQGLRIFTANKLEECGDRFLCRDVKLKTLRASKLKKCGSYFCSLNEDMEKCDINKLEEHGAYFFYGNSEMRNKVIEQCAGTLINRRENTGLGIAPRNVE